MAATGILYRRELDQRAELIADVRTGLLREGQKELPSKYLYDDVGSALYEAICLLPEYGLHRAGARLMQRYAGEIARRTKGASLIAELGSGSGNITRPLLEEIAKHRPAHYFPIDISAHALQRCGQELGVMRGVGFNPLELNYLDGLAEVVRRRAPGEGVVALFLGSTVGNLDRQETTPFLRDVRRLLGYGDSLVLAADLEKPEPDLIVAYSDAAGVTASFNLNLLARLNRELGADFDLNEFRHEARWDSQNRRIEMHLVARNRQLVSIPAANLRVEFLAGESIWTESCHKFNRAEIAGLASRAGFRVEALWVDREWPFAQALLSAA